MKKSTTKILYWLLAAVILIGSFLFIMFASQSGSSSTDTSVLTDSEWIKGNPDSEIVLLEYSDFQCPACQAREPLVKKIVDEFSAHIKFVYRQFPLRSIHANAQLAAQASEAAGLQGKFWEMHGLIFEHQSDWSDLQGANTKNTFVGYAQEIGLDTDQFEADLNSRAVKDAVEADYNAGLKAQVGGTPTFFLNGQEFNLSNYEQARETLRAAIEAGA